MDQADIIERVLNLVVLLLSLTFHEYFHAWAAFRLGDDTAARMGRLTLNPIPHIDVFGTLILPLLGAPIGWAKPVPVDPSRFDRKYRMSTGDIIVSAAGPLSNLLLGTIAAVVLGVAARIVPESAGPGTAVFALARQLMIVNCGLAVFNLLPLPPLDGGHVAASLVPYRHRDLWDRFAQIAPFILLGLVFLGVTWRIIGPPVIFLYGMLRNLSAVIAA